MKFRKKQVVVEAEQVKMNLFWSPFGQPANNPFNACVMKRPKWYKQAVPMIKTLEGWLIVSPYDWIVKGIEGEFYPVRDDIFEKTYEPVEE